MIYEVHWLGIKDGKRVDETHGQFPSYEEAMNSIQTLWSKNNFTPPYIISRKHNNITILDYGFYTCFYNIVEIEDND